MRSAFQVIKQALSHFYGRMHVYVPANVLWLLLSLPLITAPAAWAGLCALGYKSVRQPTSEVADFWAGFRAHLRRTLLLGLIGLVLVVTSVSNLIAYRANVGTEFTLLRLVWFGALVLWFAPQLFAFPLLLAMDQPSLKTAYRNTAVMFLINPMYTIAVLIAAGLVILASAALPFAFVLVTGAALAVLGNVAVADRLRAAGIQPQPAFDEQATSFGDFEGYL